MFTRKASLPGIFWGLILLTAPVVNAQQADKRTHNMQPETVEGIERLVVCQDGAIYRGDLLEYEPRDHITLRLSSGKVKRIEWSNVKSSAVISAPGAAGRPVLSPEDLASRPVAAVAAPAPTPPRTVLSPPLPRDLPERPVETRSPDSALPSDLQPYARQIATLRLKSNYPEVDVQYLAGTMEVELSSLTLIPVTASAEKWKVACEAPCGVPVNHKATFRVVGDGMMTSAPFTLPNQGRDFTLIVKGGSKAGRVVAWVSLILGGASAAVSSILLTNSTDSNGTVNDTLVKAGWGTLGTSAGLMLLSIPLFVTSRTRLSVRTNDKNSDSVQKTPEYHPDDRNID